MTGKRHSASEQLFERALKVMPGGNTRHTVYFPPYPVYAHSASGFNVIDVDGIDRIDFVNNYSALILGHANKRVTEAVESQIKKLVAVGMPTLEEVALAELLCARIPGVEKVRFTNSGTEAVMMACKAARAHTRRPKIAKIEGAYHGTFDVVETSQSSSPDSWGPSNRPASVPLSQGTPAGVLNDVVVLPLQDESVARQLIAEHAHDLAAVIIDPLISRIGMVQVPLSYVRMVREETRKHGVLLIFDEVYSLRLGHQGAQAIWQVKPDLTTMGKIIGGGFPVGAVGGIDEVMSVFDSASRKPLVHHGGTFNGNPVTMVAGYHTMAQLTPSIFEHLDSLGNRAIGGLREVIRLSGVPAQVNGRSSVFAISMTDRPIHSWRDYHFTPEEVQRLARFHRGMLDEGILMAPHGTFVLSVPMGKREIDTLVDKAERVLRRIA